MTHGPAIKTNGLPPPTRTEPTWTTLFFIEDQSLFVFTNALLYQPAVALVQNFFHPRQIFRRVHPDCFNVRQDRFNFNTRLQRS